VPASTEIETRRAVLADADAVGAINVRAWQDAFVRLFDAADLVAMDPQERAERWRQRIAADGPDATLLVAVDPSRAVVGYVSVGVQRLDEGEEAEPGVGEVWAIYVDPTRRGTGAGGALMAAGLTELVERGCTVAVLWTPADNAVGRAFYDRGGWRVDGGQHTFTFGSRSVTEVRYRMDLS